MRPVRRLPWTRIRIFFMFSPAFLKRHQATPTGYPAPSARCTVCRPQRATLRVSEARTREAGYRPRGWRGIPVHRVSEPNAPAPCASRHARRPTDAIPNGSPADPDSSVRPPRHADRPPSSSNRPSRHSLGTVPPRRPPPEALAARQSPRPRRRNTPAQESPRSRPIAHRSITRPPSLPSYRAMNSRCLQVYRYRHINAADALWMTGTPTTPRLQARRRAGIPDHCAGSGHGLRRRRGPGQAQYRTVG